MMMQYAKDITANHGGKVIKDCVLTVPSSFTQHERAAVYAAADIANLRVLSLIEENTAAGDTSSQHKKHQEEEKIIFFRICDSFTLRYRSGFRAATHSSLLQYGCQLRPSECRDVLLVRRQGRR
jgi:Hsp70 protein